MSKRRRDAEDRRESKKAKKSHKKHKKHKASKHDSPEATITIDDYFERAKEFRVWLKLEKNVCFDDLTSTDAITYFDKFVTKWNANRLDSMYYTSIPQHILESIQRTQHKWGFKMNEHERLELASMKDSVDISTNTAPGATSSAAMGSTGHRSATAIVSRRDIPDCDSDEERKRAKRERKAYAKHKEMVHEELAPKPTGREATIEKKRQIAASVHGAARQKEDAKDGLNLSDDFLMGGSDDFQARLQRRKYAQDRRADEMNQRVAAAKDAEAARMQKFLADMGIQLGQERIQIAPRQ